MKSVPRSPFTTPLSRSARETEPRIRGILPWKKQRPPLLAPVLAVLILSCGGLAACQAQGGTPSDMPAAQSGEAWSTQAVLDALFQSSDGLHPLPRLHPRRAAGHPGHLGGSYPGRRALLRQPGPVLPAPGGRRPERSGERRPLCRTRLRRPALHRHL